MNYANLAAYLGAGLAMGLGAIGAGWGIGYAVTGSLRGMARQPVKSPTIFRTMLIGQAIAETPAIFALVIALLLFFMGGDDTLAAADSLAKATALLSAGLCIGIGALGSGAGSGIVASDALEAIARTPASQGRVTLMMIISQAWCQTPVIFSLVIALLLLLTDNNYGAMTTLAENMGPMGKLLGMGMAMGAGAIGPAIGIAFVGGKTCKAVAESPEHIQKIRNTLFVGAAVSESTAIYSLVIALILQGV